MKVSNKKAFTILELIFVIVIIGILSAVAIPRFAATRDDAVITKAATTVASIRSAIATERQKRILRGDFTTITAVDGTVDATDTNVAIFDFFDNVNVDRVLEYPLRTCASGTARGCWIGTGTNLYRYRFPHNATNVDFNIINSRFDCTGTVQADCDLLTQ